MLKEGMAVQLSDGEKYQILKKVEMEGYLFWCALKVGKEPDIYIFKDDEGELEPMTDPIIVGLIMEQVNKELFTEN